MVLKLNLNLFFKHTTMSMRSFRKVNPLLKANNDTGFGSNVNSSGGRFINKDGTFNLRREGISPFRKISIYQKMLAVPTWKFICIILIFYFVLNLFFTAIYLLIGADQLQGMIAHSGWARFKEVFYFSTQTFTTVGYGRVNPVGDAANIISSIEALSGFMSFAIATGLIYGRFAKPKSYLLFSDNALISPHHGGTALMFRFVTYKDNHTLTNVEIKVNIALKEEEHGKPVYKFYDLDLERYKVESLPMNWTVVHTIDEKSPLSGFTMDDIIVADVELYVLITAFDEVFSNPVLQRTSYTYREMRFDAKFVPMYRESADGMTTILEMHKLNEIIDVAQKNK
jgi:inward rectifier potassium channel